MQNALYRGVLLACAALLLLPLVLFTSPGCGSVGIAVCGDWWCVGTPIPPPCYYCFSASSAGGDLNGDTIPDLVYVNQEDGVVRVRLGDGMGGVGAETTFTLGIGRIDFTRLADVSGDGNLDVVLVNAQTGQVQALLGDGGGGLPTQGPVATAPVVGTILDAEAGRVDGGTNDDIVLLDEAGGVVAMLGGAGGALTAAPAGRQALGCGGTALDVGTIDGDTLADLVVVDEGTFAACVFVGAGTGAFTASGGALPLDQRPRDPLLVELDGQAGLDLALLVGDGSIVQVWSGNGAGGFTRTGDAGTGGAGHALVGVPRAAAPAGPVDLAVLGGGLQGTVRALVNDGSGTLTRRPETVVLDHPATDAIATDLEMDGRIDLIVVSGLGITILTGGPAQD